MTEVKLPADATVSISSDSIPIVAQPTAHMPLPPTTTEQEDLTTAGQRRINMVWEYTQAIIALMVVLSTMICGVVAMIYPNYQIPNAIGIAFGMITGFYFSRTNHAAIGGIGKKPMTSYDGR